MSSRYRYNQPGPGYSQGPEYGAPGGDPQSYERQEKIQEVDNDSLILDLHTKVGMLKNLSYGIGDEVRKQNSFLDGMHDDFEKGNGLLANSMRRLKKLGQMGGGNYFYLSIFCLFVFVVTYWMIR